MKTLSLLFGASAATNGKLSIKVNLETCMNLETAMLTWKHFGNIYNNKFMVETCFEVDQIVSKSIMFPTYVAKLSAGHIT